MWVMTGLEIANWNDNTSNTNTHTYKKKKEKQDKTFEFKLGCNKFFRPGSDATLQPSNRIQR